MKSNYLLLNYFLANYNKFNIWLQWTLEKCIIDLYLLDNAYDRYKWSFITEDIISTLDKQKYFIKFMFKISTMQSVCWKKSIKTTWNVYETLSIGTRLEESDSKQNAIIDLVITIAETKNAIIKWGTQTKRHTDMFLPYITEVILNIQCIDFFIDVELLSIYIVAMKDSIKSKKIEVSSTMETFSVLAVKDIPIIYFSCNGLRFYIPKNEYNAKFNTMIMKVYYDF